MHGAHEQSNVRGKHDYYMGYQGNPWRNNMASRADTATTELALSQGDQEALSEFLTEYFTSSNHEFSSGK